jgi:hypothetical protein
LGTPEKEIGWMATPARVTMRGAVSLLVAAPVFQSRPTGTRCELWNSAADENPRGTLGSWYL